MSSWDAYCANTALLANATALQAGSSLTSSYAAAERCPFRYTPDDQSSTNIDAWLLFTAQIGYSNAHATLALTGVVITIISYYRTRKAYARLTGASDLSSLTEYQLLHVLLHWILAIMFSAFLAGFILNVFAIHRGWIVASAVVDTLEFLSHSALYLISKGPWQSNSNPTRKLIGLLVILLLPSLFNTISVIGYVGTTGSFSTQWGLVAQYSSIATSLCRNGLSSSCLFGSTSGLSNSESMDEYQVRFAVRTISIASLIAGICSSLFTLDVFCPQVSLSTYLFVIRYLEWFYLVAFIVLVVHIALIGSKLSATGDQTLYSYASISSPKQMARVHDIATNRLPAARAPRPKETTDAVRARWSMALTQSQKPAAYMLPPLSVQDSNTTLAEEEYKENAAETSPPLLSTTPQFPSAIVHRNRHLLVQIIGFLFGIAASLVFTVDILYWRGPIVAVPTALLSVFSVITISQVGLGIFNSTDRPHFHMIRSLPVSIVVSFFIAVGASVAVLCSPYPFYLSFGLWPLGSLLCLASTAQMSLHSLSPFSVTFKPRRPRRKTVGVQSTTEKARVDALQDNSETSRRARLQIDLSSSIPAPSRGAFSVDIPEAVIFFLRSLSATLIFFAVILTTLSGTILSLAISACLVAAIAVAGMSQNVANPLGLLLFWLSSGLLTSLFVSVAVLPLISFPRAYSTAAVYQTISDGISSSAYSTALADGAIGYYIRSEFLSAFPSDFATMVAYSVAKNATLLIEIDDMSAATSAICKFREKPQIVVVAKSLKSAFMIGSLGVRDTSVAVGHGFGAQTIWDVGTLSNVKNFWEAHPAEMIALNPWLGIASRKRGRRLISQPLIIKQAETDGSLIDIVLSGVTDLSALNVKMGIKQAGRSPLWDYLKLDVQPTVSIPTTVVNTTAISLDTAASAAASIPFAAKWAISCLTPAIIFFIAVGSKSLNRKSGRLHNDRNAKHGEETRRTDEQARNIVAEASSRVIASAASPLFQPTHDDQDEFAKEIDAIPVAQRPTQTIAIFLELIAIAAWAMFCVGAGNSDGNPGALDATGYTTCVYIFAVSGFLSAGVSMLCLKGKPNTGLLSLAVVLLGICCFTGGFVTHALLRYGMNGSAAKLALTGAATFGAARALSALFSGVQYSYISLELEHLLVGLSVVGTAGWILVAIGMGRVQVNTISGETVQTIGQLGAVTAGSLACSISFAASWFNTPILMAAAMFFSVASIFFCGGLITSTATACFSGTGCSSQQIVIFCGGLVLLISATVSFGMRASNRDTEETKKREFTVQFRDVASLSQPRGLSVSQEQFDDHPVFVNIGASTFTPFTHHKQKWLVWKAFACSSIVGWVLFLGGFGSSVTVSNESIACGTVFAVFAPAAVTCTWLSLVNDSRSIAIVAHIMWTISLTASGKVLFESISLAVSGLSTSTLFTVIGLLIFVVTTALSSSYVLNMFDLADEDQASVHSTFYATGAFAAIYTVGLGLWLSKLDNVDSTVAGILACVFGVFACGIQGCLILAYSGKDRTALKFVALVLFCFAYIQMGASIILSGVNAYSCGTASCAKITQAGLILSIIGGLGFVTCSTVTACSVLRFGYFDTISDRAVVEKAPVIPDPESLSENDSSIDEGELKPPAPRPLDIFTLMQAWPRQRAWLKICSAILLWAAGLLDASLGSMRLDKDWRMDQLGVAIVAVSGILAALISISWICRGDVSAFIFGQFLLLITVSMSGYTTVWAAADNLLSFTGGVLAESIVCGLCSATILVLLLAWNKPQVAKFSGPLTTFDICHFFNGLAWLAVSATLVLTVVKFGLASVAQTMTDIVFIAVNAATTAVYLAYKIDQHRSIFYALLLLTILSIFTGGGLLYGAVRSIAKPESGLSGLYLGISIINLSLAFVSLTSNSVCVLYQAIQWKEIEVFPFMSFQQDAVPDRSLMWLRSPNSRLLLIALKLALLFAFMGWVVFVFGLGFTPNTSLAPPLIIHHLFSVSTPIAVAGSTLYLYLQWVVFAVFGFAAAILSFATAGAAAASIVLRASSTQFMPLLALAGLSVSVAALITAYTIILHRQRPLLPNDEQTASIFSSILIGMSLGLLLIVVSIGLDQGADAATYMEISFPGLFAFLVLLLEKLRPGRPFHQLSKAAAVFLTSVSLIATGGSFQFVGGALGGGAPGPYIRLAGNFFVALGNASYLVLVFYYRLRNTGEAGESEEALNEDSDLTIVTDRDLSSATVLSTDTEQVDSSQDVFKSAETVATDVNQETRSATVDSSKDDSSSV